MAVYLAAVVFIAFGWYLFVAAELDSGCVEEPSDDVVLHGSGDRGGDVLGGGVDPLFVRR